MNGDGEQNVHTGLPDPGVSFNWICFFGLPKKKMHIKERSGKSTDGRRFFSLKS